MDLTYIPLSLISRLSLFLLCWGVGDSYAHTQPKPIPIYAPALGQISKEMVQTVFTEICNQRIAFPQQVMKQAILETGWFRSDFLMSRNNLFGFRKVRYLRFDSWQESVKYYKEWQQQRLKPKHTHYPTFLKIFHYATPNYIKHLAKISWEQECPVLEVAKSAAPDMTPAPAILSNDAALFN